MNVFPDFLLGPDNLCIRYVGNSFLITWWQYLFDITRCYRNSSYTPVVSVYVGLGGRTTPLRG